MWLFGLSLLVVVCTARCTEADVSVEAAFQGRCGHGSPCEQLCYELHDGMYECDCTEGFELNKNGYSCQELNSTSSDDAASTSVEEDVLYQRGASFSAKLDMSDLHISMKTYDDDGDDGDGDGEDGTGHTGEADMKPINLNSIDGQLTLRKANHNWKVAAANNKTARVKEAAAGKSSPVHLELNGGGALRIQKVATAPDDYDQEVNRGEIKALALTALEDEPAAGSSATAAPLDSATTVLPAADTSRNVTDSPTTVAPPATTFTEASEPCSLDCGFEGVCSKGESSQHPARCLCPYGKAGLKCEEDSHVNTPRFNQHSWLAFPALRGAYKHVQLHIEFRPESFDGILLLTGERDDLTGDFMALLLHQGFVEFWFDCGSGTGRVRSEETIVLNQWNSITIYRHRWDAWLVLNQGNRVQGRSKGLFSRITFREPVYLGGFGNITGLDKKLPVGNGFTGCIRKFVANDHDYNFQPAAVTPGDVTRGFDIQECVTDRCSRYPCQHGGKCLPSDDGAICLCPLGFGGDLCEMRLDLQVPSFNGSSYLRYAPLGDSCIIWFELKIIIKPLLEDGLLLYSGHHDYGDYISLCLNMGYVEFTFDLGSGPATVRSEFPLSMGQWHTIKVSRTSRLAVLKIDQLPEVMTVSPNGFWHLSLPHSLYLGGVHNIHTLPMSLRDKGSFAGCVQKVDINDRTIAIISEALGGSNVENCPHACVARPCGPLAKCVPNLDSYECQCNPQNKQCNKAEELPPEVIEAPATSKQRVRVEEKQRVTRRYEMEEYEDEEDDERTTTVAPTTQVTKSGSGESSEDEYYYYEYDDEDSGTPEVRKDDVVVKESEKIVLKVERKKEEPEVTTSAEIDYEDKGQVGAKSSAEDGQSYNSEEDGDSDDDDYDDEGSNLVESEPKKNYQKKVEKLSSFDKKPRKFSTVNKVDVSGSSGVANDAQDDAGYNQDYDRNGDRIPYRPDLLVRKAEKEQPQPRSGRGKQRRPEPERDSDIDEILIEEMSRIMKNKDEDDVGEEDDAGDVTDVSVDDNSWSYGMGDEELRHAGASIGPASLDDTPEQNLIEDEEENNDGDGDDDDDDDEKNKPNLEKSAPPTEESSLLQQQQQKEREKQVLEQEQHEDEVVRKAEAAAVATKYKGKYFRRRYQGACFTGTESYFHYSDAETMRRVISYEIDLNLRFKTHSANGLILWTGRHSALEGDDFLSLGVENGYLHLRYNLGSGEINIKYISTKVSDGLWHRVRALRNSQEGTLKVDGGKPITRRSPGKLRQLNTDTGLYVGGLPAAPFYTRQRYTAGIVGCISELILAGELRLNFDSTILGTAHNVEPGAP